MNQIIISFLFLIEISTILNIIKYKVKVLNKKKNLCVIIPVFNEEKTVTEILDIVIARPETAEIIVVDDASTDKSRDVIEDYA